MSLTIAVKLITFLAPTEIVKFCEHWSLVPVAVLLKYSLTPVWFITNLQKLNPVSSLTLAVILTTWFNTTVDRFRDALILGFVVSAPSVMLTNVEFCFTLLLVSVTNIVKLITAGDEGNIVTLLTCAAVPEMLKFNLVTEPLML